MYEIKILSSNEFDEVARSDPRYSYVDDSNMGFADREKGIAYIRDSNIHDLNKYLINHELEELEEAESTHEDPNGIRHKKFFKEIFMPAITFGALSLGNKGGMFNLGAPEGQKFNLLGASGSKSHLNKSETVTGGMGGPQTSPFGDFRIPTSPGGISEGGAFGTPRISETVTGGIQSGLNKGLGGGVGAISPDLLQRLRGNYGGRIQF